MAQLPSFIISEETGDGKQSSVPPPASSTRDVQTSSSSFENTSGETGETRAFSIHSCTAYSMEDHLSALQSLSRGDFNDEKAIEALPRRRNKSQRPLAIHLARLIYSEESEISA